MSLLDADGSTGTAVFIRDGRNAAMYRGAQPYAASTTLLMSVGMCRAREAVMLQ